MFDKILVTLDKDEFGGINYAELVQRIFEAKQGETLASMDLHTLEIAAIIEMGDENAGKGSYSDE